MRVEYYRFIPASCVHFKTFASLSELNSDDIKEYNLDKISIETDNNKRSAPQLIEVKTSDHYWRMSLLHEIAHILLGWRTSIRNIKMLRMELLSWRIAKTFCKPELWDDKDAIHCFSTYLK